MKKRNHSTSTDEIVDITKRLIQYKTIGENRSEIDDCLSYIKKYFKDFVVREYSSHGKKSLVISYTNKKKFKLILNGHIDVVDADPDQFLPYIKNNRLYGRGAIDMKAGVAVFMKLMKDFYQTKPDVALMIVSDEETGGLDGTGYLIKHYSADLVIGSEPNQSGNDSRFDITVSHKGVLWLKVRSFGKACHASRPWLGKNAVDKLIEKYLEIRKIFPLPKSKSWTPTLNLSKISAGDSINRVPDYAEMYLDIRFTEKPSIKEIIQKLRKIRDVEIEIIEKTPLLLNRKMKEINNLGNLVESISGTKVNLLKEHGASDMRFFSEKNIPAVLFGPWGKNYHGKDEFSSVKSMSKYYEIMKKYIGTINR